MDKENKDIIKEFYVCPLCGGAICGKKRKYFVCPECGSVQCEEKKLADFAAKHCGRCGTSISSTKHEALALGKKTNFQKFYACSNCGSAICGERKKYFVCPECEKVLCEESKLADYDDSYCVHCGTNITSAKAEAQTLVGKQN